jgi:hypothetical protein
MPWVISLGLHVALVILLAAATYRASVPGVNQQAVEILVVGARGSAISQGGSGETQGQPGHGKARATGLTMQRPIHDADRGVDQPVSGSPLTAAFPVPNATDVLSDVPSAGSANAAEGTGQSEGTQFGWEGPARKLLRKRNPVFPSFLSTEGQEVECQARITVMPSGRVRHVEIISGSGYIEIDAIVEAALRDYLFSRVDGRKDAVGTVRFHFRLERQD